MHRQDLLNLIAQHQTRFMEEAAFIQRAARFINAHESIFNRELFPMHVTGSAWVINENADHVLLLHHKKLNRWFQPGGHADGDNDVLRVALKETAEETGLDESHIRLVSPQIFDLDIHTIPHTAHDPRHEHIDVRFLVQIDSHISIPGNTESHEVRWVPLHAVTRFNNNQSSYRMLEKTRRYLHRP